MSCIEALLKPAVGILRVVNPAGQELANSRKRVLRGGGAIRPAKRKQRVDGLCKLSPVGTEIAGANAARKAERSTEASKRPDTEVPSGSESRARAQALIPSYEPPFARAVEVLLWREVEA